MGMMWFYSLYFKRMQKRRKKEDVPEKGTDSYISHSNDLDSLSYQMLTFSMNSF